MDMISTTHPMSFVALRKVEQLWWNFQETAINSKVHTKTRNENSSKRIYTIIQSFKLEPLSRLGRQVTRILKSFISNNPNKKTKKQKTEKKRKEFIPKNFWQTSSAQDGCLACWSSLLLHNSHFLPPYYNTSSNCKSTGL